MWVTLGHGHTTYWYVAHYNTADRHAQYVRVTPEASTGTVDVSIAANGNGGATVNVAYHLTGLSLAGNEHLDGSLSEPQYAEMMEEWRTLINESRKKIDERFGR